MTLVTPGIDAQGRVLMTSRGTTYKVKHIRRDPRVSMTAEIVDQPEAIDALVYWYKQVRGEHKNWNDYKKQMQDEKRVIIRVNIEKVGPQSVNRI